MNHIKVDTVWILDYVGHPFTSDLAASLVERGAQVRYSYCASHESPRGNFEATAAAGAEVFPIDLGREFATHNPARRLLDELEYGARTAFLIFRRSARSDRIIACQLPVMTALLILAVAKLRKTEFVLWLQDFQADLAALSAPGPVARALGLLETFLIRRSPSVICISDRFAQRVRETGHRGSVVVLPNWAPIASLPLRDRVNSWTQEHDLQPESFRLVYSGTMGSKHRAEDLIHIFRELLTEPTFEVIVVAAGQGADRMASEADLVAHPRFHMFPLQPLELLPDVLGSADVLLATLSLDATEACVPSKILSYLCAGRPVVALMDSANPSAELLSAAGAGLTANDTSEAISAIRRLLDDPDLRRNLGQRGRMYAEGRFSRAAARSAFCEALRSLRGTTANASGIRKSTPFPAGLTSRADRREP